jgi:hypothetical protein
VGAVASVTGAVVSTAVDVTGAVVGGAARTVTGGSDKSDKSDKDDSK